MTHLLDKLTRERNAFRELDNELTELCELSGYDTEARNIEIRDMENELDQMRSNIAAILRQIRDDTENEQTSYPTQIDAESAALGISASSAQIHERIHHIVDIQRDAELLSGPYAALKQIRGARV